MRLPQGVSESKSPAAIMGFLLSTQAVKAAGMTKEQRQQAICEQYARAFGMKEFLSPTEYIELDWTAEEWSGGCFVGVFLPCLQRSFHTNARC